MKIDLKQTIKNSTGIEPMVIPASINEPEKELTLRTVCIRAVLTPIQKDTPVVKEEKYKLWKKIIENKDEQIEFTVKELALLQELIGLLEPQLIMGQAHEMLEGKGKT